MSAIKCERLTRANKNDLLVINLLLGQMSSSAQPITPLALNTILKNKNFYFIVLRDAGQIIGMGNLVVYHAPFGVRSRIEDMVVDEAYRGRGLGALLTRKLIAIAKTAKVRDIELSTRPSRVAANGLYRNLGFEQKETNVYSYKFKR